MSVKATSRAWDSSASGTDLLVLLALADVAGGVDDPYDYAYPAVPTIAAMTKVSTRTVQRSLRALEEAGTIRKTGEHVWAPNKVTTQYRIEEPGRGDRMTPPTPEAERGDVRDVSGVTPTSPNPSLDPPSPTHTKKKDAPEPDAFPSDLPEHLHEVAVAAGKILKRTAQQRGQKREVTRAAVGHAVLTHPDRDHVKVARDVEGWLLHGKGARRPCSDIVARYRSFLSNAEPMPGPPLPGLPHDRGDRPGGPSSGAANLRGMAERLREQAAEQERRERGGES